jgi:hypothetical protein
MKKCSVEGCEKIHFGLGYCQKHRRDFVKYGKPRKFRLQHNDKCCVCKSTFRMALVDDKVYCGKHKQQISKYGYVLKRTIRTPNKIVICNDFAYMKIYNIKKEFLYKTKIDLDDVDRVKNIKWHDSKGYVLSAKHGYLSRFLLNYEGEDVVDHINRNPLDNRKRNLRVISQNRNTKNRSVSIKNTSGITGITYDKSRKKWVSQFTYNYKKVFHKRFDTFEEAVQSRENIELKYYGEVIER